MPGLPEEREETLAPGSQIKSATQNAMQDAIVGLHEDLRGELVYPVPLLPVYAMTGSLTTEAAHQVGVGDEAYLVWLLPMIFVGERITRAEALISKGASGNVTLRLESLPRGATGLPWGGGSATTLDSDTVTASGDAILSGLSDTFAADTHYALTLSTPASESVSVTWLEITLDRPAS